MNVKQDNRFGTNELTTETQKMQNFDRNTAVKSCERVYEKMKKLFDFFQCIDGCAAYVWQHMSEHK